MLWMALALLACSSTPPPADSGDEGGEDGLARCLEDWSDGLREIDPAGPDTQIHSEVAFDGSRLWFAWNRPNDDATFDVWGSIVGCDGAGIREPTPVSDSRDNEIDPTLAFAGGRALVAWTGSAGGGLDIRARVLDADGAPATAVAAFAGTRGGAPVTGNATLPALATTGDAFVLAGSWGHPDAPAFQAFVATLDVDGQPIGDADDVELDRDHGQTYVDVAVVGEAPRVVWQEDRVDTATASAWLGAPGEAPSLLGEPGYRPAVVADAAGVWAAWDDNAGAVFLRTPEGADLELDLGAGFHHSPQLAAADGTVALLVLEVESGIYNRLRLVRLSASGVVAELPVSASGVPSVYEASLTLVDGQHAVVAWQEGDNPAFRAWAEWISWEP